MQLGPAPRDVCSGSFSVPWSPARVWEGVQKAQPGPRSPRTPGSQLGGLTVGGVQSPQLFLGLGGRETAPPFCGIQEQKLLKGGPQGLPCPLPIIFQAGKLRPSWRGSFLDNTQRARIKPEQILWSAGSTDSEPPKHKVLRPSSKAGAPRHQDPFTDSKMGDSPPGKAASSVPREQLPGAEQPVTQAEVPFLGTPLLPQLH